MPQIENCKHNDVIELEGHMWHLQRLPDNSMRGLIDNGRIQRAFNGSERVQRVGEWVEDVPPAALQDMSASPVRKRGGRVKSLDAK